MEKYQKANTKNPFMGLSNQICTNPKYWCRLYQVWLSEDDVEKKHCKCKTTYDMLGTIRCGCLEEKNMYVYLYNLYKKINV